MFQNCSQRNHKDYYKKERPEHDTLAYKQFYRFQSVLKIIKHFINAFFTDGSISVICLEQWRICYSVKCPIATSYSLPQRRHLNVFLFSVPSRITPSSTTFFFLGKQTPPIKIKNKSRRTCAHSTANKRHPLMCLRSRGQGCFIHKRPTMIRIVERLSGLRRLHHGTLLREARRSLYHLYGFATSVTYRTLPPKWRNNQSKTWVMEGVVKP